jgi:small-conductance mechanosensitive channel
MRVIMMSFFDSLINWETPVFILGIVVLAGIFTKVIRWLMNKSFISSSDKLRVDATRYKFLNNAVSLIIWIVALAAIISLIPELKALAYSLFAGAGIFLAIIGLAAQQAFSNIISGIFIVLFRPFRVGDQIKVGSLGYGIVEDITLRHTILNNFENKRIIIPNSVISIETIVNDSIQDTKICRWIEIGISYDSDIDHAMSIMQEEAIKHPGCIDNRTKMEKDLVEPVVSVNLISFGDFSVNLRAYVWLNDPYSGMKIHSEINKAIKLRFDNEGIEIPFPYRTVVYKKDLPKNKKPSKRSLTLL